jgi:hypothetical protein
LLVNRITKPHEIVGLLFWGFVQALLLLLPLACHHSRASSNPCCPDAKSKDGLTGFVAIKRFHIRSNDGSTQYLSGVAPT